MKLKNSDAQSELIDDRRKVLTTIGKSSAITITGLVVSESEWSKPIINSVITPAHAQTSEVPEEEPEPLASCADPLTTPITVPGYTLSCIPLNPGDPEISQHFIYVLDDSDPENPQVIVTEDTTSSSADLPLAPARGFALENILSDFAADMSTSADGARLLTNNNSIWPGGIGASTVSPFACGFRGGNNNSGDIVEINFTSRDCGNAYTASFTVTAVPNTDQTMLTYEVSTITITPVIN